MIVRILTDNQYRVDEKHMHAIARLDNDLLEAVHKDDDLQFESLLEQLIGIVREHGQLVPHDELVASDMVIPAPDMSLAEAKKYLDGSSGS